MITNNDLRDKLMEKAKRHKRINAALKLIVDWTDGATIYFVDFKVKD